MKTIIEWEQINTGNKTTGRIYTTCPNCSADRKKKTAKCLSVNLESGKANCKHCQAVSFREGTPKPKQRKEWVKPIQTWRNFTTMPDKVVKWFAARGISQRTIVDCGITCEDYFQPMAGKKTKNVVFNYFEFDEVVNKKYRRISEKQFTQSKDAKKIFYGINDIMGHDEIYIVEGEMDKLAMYEVGIKNCISVPNGANDCNDIFDTCEEYIKDIKKVFIAVDMDEPGLKLEKELIKRFGKWKCERINFKGKDANEELIKGKLELLEAIENPKPYPCESTRNISDVWGEILESYDHEREYIKPKCERFENFNTIFSLAPGQLTTVTGTPSHGKSNFVEDWVLSLCATANMRASFFTPEHPVREVYERILEKTIGKSFPKKRKFVERMTKTEMAGAKDYLEKKIYMTDPEPGTRPTWEWLLAKFKEQIFRFGVDIFIIDAWNKVKMQNPDSLGEINGILSDLTLFARQYNVQVVLIAHPKKPGKSLDGKEKIPTLYDVKGSSDFRDQTHNGFVVSRDFETNIVTVVNLKTKFQDQGKIGASCEFIYDLQCSRYNPIGKKFDRKPLFETNTQTSIKPEAPGQILPNKNFEQSMEMFPDATEQTDVPF